MSEEATEPKENKIVSAILSLLRETFMVIVGILLALQIDGYVGDIADTNTLKSNLNYVIEDLNNNKKALLAIKEVKEKSIAACTELIDNYKQHKSMHSDDILNTLVSILKTNKFVNDQSGFDRIKSSPLYESDDFFSVRDKIRTYNGILADLRFTENFINTYITSLSLEMSKNGELLKVFDYVRMKLGIAQYKTALPHFEVDEILRDNKPLQAVLHKYEFDALTLIENYTKLIKTGEALRTEINTYLEE
ncbi:hypothetical protein H2O64_21420 [Kordia sp. YSTF-M3]|uniref:Uncharacterized protein n=1 Tax=Kordia aestuariivivens TaxID=2759037 RepID=A0ABR7QF92_9FLAO|nr:hypothetical protein [Kordia aestuariivivens]MBC8757244.1 hypothetical protein [Kordia aestuariivivens]